MRWIRNELSLACNGITIVLVPNPRYASSDARADTADAEEDTRIFGASGHIRELDDITDYAHKHAADDEDATLEYPVRPPGNGQRGEKAKCIGRDREQVGIGSGVAKCLNN